MKDDDLYAAMHAAADVVERKLRRFLTAEALDSFDGNAILLAGQEWLDEGDDDVELLRKAIDDFNTR